MARQAPLAKAVLPQRKDRYHLYVSLPASGHTARRLMLNVVLKTVYFRFRSEPADAENGWTLHDSFPGATGDTLYQHEFLYQLYLHADPHYSGRVTVPARWGQNHTIVSNESAEQKSSRMFTTAFDALGRKAGD